MENTEKQYTLSEFLKFIKDGSLRNLSQDHFDNSHLIYKINNALIYAYARMNSMGSRYYSNTEDFLGDLNSEIKHNSWNLTNKCAKIFQIEELENNTILWQRNVSNNINDNPRGVDSSSDFVREDSFIIKDLYNISTKQSYKSIRVNYSRLPKFYSDKDLAVDFDCPVELVGAVEMYTLRLTNPHYYEQGVSLANAYFSMAEEYLRTYAKNIGMQVSNIGFIPG